MLHGGLAAPGFPWEGFEVFPSCPRSCTESLLSPAGTGQCPMLRLLCTGSECLSARSLPQAGPRDCCALGGTPWEAAGWTHRHGHSWRRAKQCPLPRAPQSHRLCLGIFRCVPAPWKHPARTAPSRGCHQVASSAKDWAKPPLPSPGTSGELSSVPPYTSAPTEIPAFHSPLLESTAGHWDAGGWGIPSDPLSAGKGCPFGATQLQVARGTVGLCRTAGLGAGMWALQVLCTLTAGWRAIGPML